MSERSEFMALIDTARYDPSSIQQLTISQVERTHKGELEIMDGMNPFAFLCEAAATIGAQAMTQAEVLTRRQYPSVALTYEDLYFHMADVDYIGRFGTPSKTTFSIIMGKEELYAMAVATGAGGVRKLTIPRNTVFGVGGYLFTMQYPVDLRIMAHGGMDIVYDASKPSPIQTLTGNKLDWSIQNYYSPHDDFVKLDIPVLQLALTSYNAPLNGATGFKKTYSLKNGSFYYCRAYMSDLQGNWIEILTTHSDQVFDPLKPTVLLRVQDDIITASLPQVYFTTGLLNTELRLDLYTTVGPLELALQTFDVNQFKATWIDLDKSDNGIYSAPLSRMTTLSVYSDDTVTGGSLGLSFEEQRERVMSNSLGLNDLPITNAQITAKLSDAGYSTVLNTDNITNRVFLATRMFPKPAIGDLTVGMGTAMATLVSSIKELTGISTVIDNGDRLTLTPDTLYATNNGVLSIVPDDKVATLKALSNDRLVDHLDSNNYLFSPFTYVFDSTENTFVTRPYYFKTPEIMAKYFLADNDTSGVGVSSAQHDLTRVDGGWRLRIVTSSGDEFNALDDANVFVQLTFKPIGEDGYAVMNGTLVGRQKDTNERIYDFFIATNWDINSSHDITLTNFSMYEAVNRNFATDLVTDFNLVYIVANRMVQGQEESWIDTQKGAWLLPAQSVGVYQEKLQIKLGNNLEGLWTRARSVIGSLEYLTYEEDVYETWGQTVYETDPVTGAKIIEMVDGKPTFKVKYRKGTVVLDGQGQPTVIHHKGYAILDEFGDPVPKDVRAMQRRVDLFVMDGVYYFASGAVDTQYRDTVPATVVEWLDKDIVPLSKKLLEQTKLYLHPKSTIGLIDVTVDGSKKTQIEAAQSLKITYFVSDEVYKDPDLRASLIQSGLNVISAQMLKSVVALESMRSTLSATVGGDVIDLEIEGLGGANGYRVVTVRNDSGRLCIGKKAVSKPDGTIVVQNDLAVTFERHQVD